MLSKPFLDNFGFKKAKIERRLRWAGFAKFEIRKDLSVDFPTVEILYFSSLLTAMREPRLGRAPFSIYTHEVQAFDAGELPITSFEYFPEIVQKSLRVRNVQSLKDMHKRVKYIGKYLYVGNDKLPTNMLSLTLIEGNFKVLTTISEFNVAFNARKEDEDILITQDRLIDAGFEPQARF